jgi:hypothetical protein
MGSRQGDIKVIIPSRNDIKYCIDLLLSFGVLILPYFFDLVCDKITNAIDNHYR